MTDNVNHPAHYTSHPSGIECIEVVRHYCFSIGNAIKYLWRAGLKKEQGIDEKTCFEDYVVEKMFEEDRKILKSQPLVENETNKAVENTTTKKVDKIEDK